ncbi:MAG: hypothetical protein V7637_1695 [Mycobacteriales bacterium]
MAAAIALADAEGLAAVSIRRVAAELGARTMSLYTHIARKEDLLQLMVDEVAAEAVLPPGALPAGWRAAITMIVEQERAVAGRHPWLIELLRGEIRFGPNGLRHAEQTMVALSGLGLGPAETFRVAAAIDVYSAGRVIREEADSRRDGATGGRRQAMLEPYFQRLLNSGEFPHLAPLLAAGGAAGEGAYDQGLVWLLDGIEAQYGR